MRKKWEPSITPNRNDWCEGPEINYAKINQALLKKIDELEAQIKGEEMKDINLEKTTIEQILEDFIEAISAKKKPTANILDVRIQVKTDTGTAWVKIIKIFEAYEEHKKK